MEGISGIEVIGATKRINENEGQGWMLVDNLGYLDGFTENAASILKLNINHYVQLKRNAGAVLWRKLHLENFCP